MVVKNGDEFHGRKHNITLNKSERMHKKKMLNGAGLFTYIYHKCRPNVGT